MPARKKAAKRKVVRKTASKKSRVKVSMVSCECFCHRGLGGKLVCPKCLITFCSNLSSR